MKTPIKIVVAAALILSMSACSSEVICKKGSGGIHSEELFLDNIDGIDMQIAADVVIKQGNSQKIVVTGHQNVLNEIDMDVYGGIWKIKFDNGCFRHYDLDVEITVPDLKKVIISGSGDIDILDFDNQNELDLRISGSGNIHLHEFEGIHKLRSSISGSGNITAFDSISVKETDIFISGSGNYKAYPISTEDCKIKISGSGSCFVNVSHSLDVSISGSGDVHYKGYPSIHQHISGSGHIYNDN
ncbi:MAG: DUF2807 domain-containing protein [Bacteroidia bacterium]